MRHNKRLAAVVLTLVSASAARAEDRSFSIHTGRLGAAAIALAQQAGLTIGINDPSITALRTRGVTGRMPVRKALDRLLAGTGCSYVFVDAQSVRIFRQSAARAPVRPPRRATPADSAPRQAADIIVTASKQRIALDRFPGTVRVIDLTDPRAAHVAARGTHAVLDQMPTIVSTNLGPGRDKLFIRGVADSSFNGPSQATVGQYLGDVRLNYSAPDPDLALYDIGHVEVLEGPQGTLYGTGSLGGILRLVPNPPDPAAYSASAALGASVAQKGGVGTDIAVMLNVPLIRDRLAVRGVAYRAIDAGYIDDIGRKLHNVNDTKTIGGRFAARLVAGNGWTFDAGGALQNIIVNDGQYAQSGLPPLTRRSKIAQPFDNDYALGYISARRSWAWGELLSTTGYVAHSIATTFDASGFPGTAGPVQFDETVGTTLLSHETRISGRGARTTWLAGVSLLHSVDRLQRRLGPVQRPLPILGVRNEATEAAAFGQTSVMMSPRIAATLGGRLNYAQAAGAPLDKTIRDPIILKRSGVVFLPMAGVTWQVRQALTAYAQIQQGYRAGGLDVAPARPLSATQRFGADRITTAEAGLRFGVPDRTRVWGDMIASFARWVNIQSDLVARTGLPYTTNIGDGRILGLEGRATWRVSRPLDIDAAFFVNKSQLDRPAPLYVAALDRELPNIAELGGRASFRYRRALVPGLGLTIDGSVRYVGKSSLGIGRLLSLDQGDYAELALGGRLDLGRFGVSLDVSNLGDVRGNRFAYGNPFSIAAGNQITPLRPRTFRIGIDAKY